MTTHQQINKASGHAPARAKKSKPQSAVHPAQILQRLEDAPASIRPADILQLQRAIGNRATERLLQTKLKLGPAGDVYEQEADRVAQQVVRASHQPEVQRDDGDDEMMQAKPLAAGISRAQRSVMTPPTMQRESRYADVSYTRPQPRPAKQPFVAPQMPKVQRADLDEEELQAKPLAGSSGSGKQAFVAPPQMPKVQREEMEEELQAAPNHGLEGGDVDTDVARSIQSAKGGGEPLHDGVRSSMERGFGADFSSVRVHTGGQSDALNRSLNARAFTTGKDIFFGKGQYNPGSSGGQELIAHELTHTVQQGAAGVQRYQLAGPAQIQRDPTDIRDDYSDLSVFSAGSMMDDEGNFAGPSQESHDAIKAQLEEAGEASAEMDIRIAMLAGKVADAWTRKQEEQARLTEANPDRVVSVIGVFTAPEWFFKNPGVPFTKDDKDVIVEAFRQMSEEYTQMLIVPGTILWAERGGGWFAKRRKMYAHAPVLLNGHLVKMHQKMINAGDTQEYFGSTRADSNDNNTYKMRAGAGGGKDTRKKERPTGKAERAYFRGQASRTSDMLGVRVGTDSSLFDVGNLNVSLEICGDHSSSGRAKADKAAMGDGVYPGAHIQIVVSHGAAFVKGRSVLRPGGVGIGNDGGEGTDSSTGTMTEQKGTREVWQKGENDRFAQIADDRGSGEADLDKLHMGTYRLPT